MISIIYTPRGFQIYPLIGTFKSFDRTLAPISSSLTIQLLVLVYASALSKSASLNRKEEIINNIRYKLHESSGSNISLFEVAEKHNVSYIWFRKAFKEVVGISPGQYLLNLRIDKASQFLKATSLSIAEICSQTGFQSESHFSRTFKKKHGISPSYYRKG